jgi:DNA-binding beta-propeller fold protein YncE
MVALGTADYTYDVIENWATLPDGWSFKEVAAVGVDAHDNVYAFNRGEHPMMVFDRNGKFLRSWGEGIFPRAHGITMAPDETMFCTDDGDHTVRKCTLDGKVLLTLGTSGKPSPFMSGNPFNRCTHVAIDPRNGDFYVSDGYGNARVHKYAPDGKLLFSWGEPGTDPGQFNIAHNIATDKEGWVYVADRENHRVQVFDPSGKFETQWVNMARPCGLYIDQEAELTYIGELGAAIGPNAQAIRLGPRISIYDTQGNLIARLGGSARRRRSGSIHCAAWDLH